MIQKYHKTSNQLLNYLYCYYLNLHSESVNWPHWVGRCRNSWQALENQVVKFNLYTSTRHCVWVTFKKILFLNLNILINKFYCVIFIHYKKKKKKKSHFWGKFCTFSNSSLLNRRKWKLIINQSEFHNRIIFKLKQIQEEGLPLYHQFASIRTVKCILF